MTIMGTTFEITKEIAVITEHATGWRKELNMIAWNEQPAKYDIRDWSPDRAHMSRGITLTETEMTAIVDALSDNGKEEALKAWICEHAVDGYEGYARALKQCGYTVKEIVDDLGDVTDDEDIAEIIKEIY